MGETMKLLLLTLTSIIFWSHYASALDTGLCKSECFKTCCARMTSQCSSSFPGGGSDSNMCNFSVCNTAHVTANPSLYCPLVVKEYEVLDIDEASSRPALNNRGEIVNGDMYFAQPKISSQLGANDTASAINDSGVIVGSSRTPGGPSGCNGGIHPLLGFGDFNGSAIGHSVNKSGIIGGTCSTGANFCHGTSRNYFACIYKNNQTTLIELEPGLVNSSLVGNSNVGVFAINSNGDAAGTSVRKINDEILEKAFYRSKAGTLIEISPTQDAQSKAYDVNKNKIVVGSATFNGDEFQAFVYKVSGNTLINLTSALGNPISSVANAINDSGVVVGSATYVNGDSESTKAFIYDASQDNPTVKFLESIEGWEFRTASDINNSGEIVGTGIKDELEHKTFMLRPLKLIESQRLNLDYDFDGLGDYSIWRPSLGGWFASQVSSRFLQWGLPQDVPLLGNFDSDVNRETVVFRPVNSTWYVNKGRAPLTSGIIEIVQHGLPGDVPLLADTNGDNLDDFVVWRPFLQNGPSAIEGQWYIRPSAGNGAKEIQWGLRGDLPYLSDFDGDGLADIGVWRNATGEWYVLKSSQSYSNIAGKFLYRQWGLPGDHPMPGDYDGDGLADLAVWRPSNGTWYFCTSRFSYECAKGIALQWGLPNDIPVSVATNGNHTLSLAIYRASEGNWYLRDIATNEIVIKQWGLPGDVPLKQSIRTTMQQMGILQ